MEARLVWSDLLQGIRKLHQLNIIHRDLKLQNILYIP
jgi:serine/threonine protein kinase